MRSIPSVALIIALTACASTGPLQFGDSQAIAPRIDPVAKEGVPLHVQVGLARPENVTVFFVVPGRGATLLYPTGPESPTRLTAGAHILPTVLADRTSRGTGASVQPNTSGAALPMPNAGRRANAATVLSADSAGRLNSEGFLLLYATDDSLDYDALVNRVTGISIPIEDDAAVSTVTKLIKGTTSGLGKWAAYSTEFVPPSHK
jgi:hypothetical protein